MIFNAVLFVVAYNALLGVSTIPFPCATPRPPEASLTEVLLPGALPNKPPRFDVLVDVERDLQDSEAVAAVFRAPGRAVVLRRKRSTFGK